MSSLMVSNDLEIMMLEFSVEKLFVPKTSIFDSVIMKKTTVMFRMLDYDWTSLNPHRTDYAPYRGSNLEEENFHGGKSIVFAIPTASLKKKMNDVDLQIHVRKEVSKYFEMESCQNVGLALVNVDHLFNGIIKELRERKELEEYLSCFHKRQPISRSLKGTYKIIDEDQRITGATITLYVRLSYLGKSIITEIDTGHGIKRAFYAQEETNQTYPYQCKEVKRSKLSGGCWGSKTFLPPVRPDRLTCHCDSWDPIVDCTDYKSDESDDEDAKYLFDKSGKDKSVNTGNGEKGGKGKKGGRTEKSRVSIGKEGRRGRNAPGRSDSQLQDVSNDKKKKTAIGNKGKPRKSIKPAGEKMKKRTEEKDSFKDREKQEKITHKSAEGANVDGSKSINESKNRRLKLRRRHCGFATVGIPEKEKKICCERSVPKCEMSDLFRPTLCSNLQLLPYCCYPSSTNCKQSQFLPYYCCNNNERTRNERSYNSFGRIGQMIPEMMILTN